MRPSPITSALAVALCGAVGAASFAACVSGGFADGHFTCDPVLAPTCPSGLVCAKDGTCRARDESTADAGADAAGDGSPPEAGAGFCATAAHDLCEDFDEGGFAGWTPSGTNVPTVDALASMSSPSALHVVLGPSGRPSAHITTDLPAPASHVTCRFAMRPDELDDRSGMIFFGLYAQRSDASSYSLYYAGVLSTASSNLWELGTRTGGESINRVATPRALPKASAWTVVRVDAQLGPSGSATLQVGTGSPITDPLDPSPADARFVAVVVGVDNTDVAGKPSDVHFDDVACDVVP